MVQDTPSAQSDKRAMLADISLLYYGEGLTQNDIAKRMKVSRATIVNMLREARAAGIVDIRVEGRSLATSTLALDLRARFGLEDAYVATAAADDAPVPHDEMLRHLGRVGAIALSQIVEPGDRVGVAWGETIGALADEMVQHDVDAVTVCQMIGSMFTDAVPASEYCAIRIAGKLSARCYTLHAPALASTAEVAALFRAEPTIRQQLDRLKSLDLVVASVGNVRDDTHLARAHIAAPDELEAAREAGAVGVFCARYIDASGHTLRLPPDDRLLASELDDLRRARKRMLVAGGSDKRDATLAAIRGGFATHLCVDRALAVACLES
jgi:DNA-binding transcriptional regulator LsrR (DeoR family)